MTSESKTDTDDATIKAIKSAIDQIAAFEDNQWVLVSSHFKTTEGVSLNWQTYVSTPVTDQTRGSLETCLTKHFQQTGTASFRVINTRDELTKPGGDDASELKALVPQVHCGATYAATTASERKALTVAFRASCEWFVERMDFMLCHAHNVRLAGMYQTDKLTNEQVPASIDKVCEFVTNAPENYEVVAGVHINCRL